MARSGCPQRFCKSLRFEFLETIFQIYLWKWTLSQVFFSSYSFKYWFFWYSAITVIFELLPYCDDLDQILTIENQCHDIFLWLRPPAKILRCHSWREINLIMYLQLNNSGIYCHLMKCAKRIWMMITWQSAVWEDDLSFSQWKI